jgi:hypothetical protein
MVEEGKVSAEDGAELLSALRQDHGSSKLHGGPSPGERRWFRIKVSDIVTGKSKTTVNIPMGLMDWGLKVGAQFAPEVAGVDFNELGEILRSGGDGKIIDVLDEEDGEHVEIFIE